MAHTEAQYPTDRELTLLGQYGKNCQQICSDLMQSIITIINVGWSTLGNKLSKAESQLEPTNETSFSHDEKSYMEAVVQRAEAEDDQEALRIKNLYKEHNELLSKCMKDDAKHLCSKCGSKPRNAVMCAECDKLFCQKCKADDQINPCPICYSRHKLWMKTGAWFIQCFDVPTDIDIQDSVMQNAMMKKTTLSQAKSKAKRNQLCKIVATSMEERSKRLQHLLKRNEEMQGLKNSKLDKTCSLPAKTAELFSLYGSSIKREHTQRDTCCIPKLDARRRSLSAGKIVPVSRIHRRFSSVMDTDNNNSFAQLHNLFPSTELLTSSSNFNFLGLHRMSRDGSDADVESICSTTDAKHLFTKKTSTASIDSNGFGRAQTASPTNQLLSSGRQHSNPLSDNERYLSDDEAYRRRRCSLSAMQYYNPIEPEDGPTLEFKLEYIPDDCELKVEILRCTGLHELSNTYVKMYIMSGPGKSKKLKTSIVYKNEAPEFNETHSFSGLSPAVINKRTIFLIVVNHCRFGSNKKIGATKVPLRKTRPNETIFFRKLLEANLPTQKSISSSELADRGKIYLGLEYCSNKEVLIVEIIKGAGLASQKSSCPNPYVKCYLVNGVRSTDGQLKRKTKVTYKTTDPVFEEELEFPISHEELHARSLCVSVWDWNQTMRNTNIGEVWIDDCDPGWEEIIDTPDHRTKGWYNLSIPTV